MDNFEQFGKAIDSFSIGQLFEHVQYSPLFTSGNTDFELLVSTISKFEDNIHANLIQTLLNEYCLQLTMNLNDKESLLKNILIIFDLSHALDKLSPNHNYTQVFTTLITIMPLEFLTGIFSDVYFDKSNEIRQLALTNNNKLQGKLRPGSKLLSLYKSITSKLSPIEPTHIATTQKFRQLIYGSLEISDKLSDNLIFHFNLDGVVSDPQRLKNIKGNGKDPTDYLLLNIKKILSNFDNLKSIITKANWSNDRSKFDSIFNLFGNILKAFKKFKPISNGQSISLDLPKNLNEDVASILYWSTNFEKFNDQLKALNNYWSLLIQMTINANLLILLLYENMFPMITECNSEMPKKFRRPQVLENLITNATFKVKIKEFNKEFYSIIGNFHSKEISYILKSSEKIWMKMKLKGFVHPSVESINAIGKDQRKRKLDEYVQSNNNLLKKPKFMAKMGTPKLTRLWRNNFSLSQLKSTSLSPKEILNDIKDDIYFARGKLESIEKSNSDYISNLDEFERLNWKSIRTARNFGFWSKFKYCDDGIVGIEGIWNPQLKDELNLKIEKEKAVIEEDVEDTAMEVDGVTDLAEENDTATSRLSVEPTEPTEPTEPANNDKPESIIDENNEETTITDFKDSELANEEKQ